MIPSAGPPPTRWHSYDLRWGVQTYVMAIINVTPDSFSEDGVAGDLEQAVTLATAAVRDGADLIDIGAESTRPGHHPITAQEEMDRLLPVLQAVRKTVTLPISVDTSKAAVAGAALSAGANLINDVRGLRGDPDMAAVVARHGVPVVIMHDLSPDRHEDLVTSVLRELSLRLDLAIASGIPDELLIADPGFGFGKDWRQNLELLRRLGELRVLGRPILSGTSRKGTIGRVLGVAAQDRLEGTAATVALSIAAGADIVRVHDVLAMARVARMTDAVIRGGPSGARTWPPDTSESRG